MMLMLLPLVSFAVAVPGPATESPVEEDVVTSPRVAQVRLAEELAGADSIESIEARGRTVTFVIVRGGTSLEVVANTRKRGDVASLTIREIDPIGAELHGLSWLADELADATAVTRLAVDKDGAVTIVTSNGRKYMAIPGRGSGGASNHAVEARWAAAWSGEDS